MQFSLVCRDAFGLTFMPLEQVINDTCTLQSRKKNIYSSLTPITLDRKIYNCLLEKFKCTRYRKKIKYVLKI